MIRINNLKLSIEEGPERLRGLAARALRVKEQEIASLRIVKRSIDARDKGIAAEHLKIIPHMGKQDGENRF